MRQPAHLNRFSVSFVVCLLAGALGGRAFAEDCNSNGLDDACDISCGQAGGPCDRPLCGEKGDCNGNDVPDECELSVTPDDCRFPVRLSENTTGFDDSNFIGPPDGTFIGLGGQIVTYNFHCALVLNGSGPDFTVYETDGGSAEFGLMNVLVSANGVDFVSVKASEAAAVNIPGDEEHDSNSFARSYDLSAAGLAAVRYIRIDGNGTGGASASGGFDLDAIGAIHMLGLDCTGNGVLDECDIADQTSADCNTNKVPDNCELDLGIAPDCNNTLTPDECDIADDASDDVNSNGIPDECDPDCNNNFVPDDWDISQGTSIDCNNNEVPDECDLDDGTSFDCNNDDRPDECPVCPTVEVVFVMDTSTSMNDEASALCASITQVVSELQADLIDVHAALLGISDAPGGSYACLTDHVINLYGTTVPGSPPSGNETLGDCPGGSQVASEDWARATSVVAGTRSWMPDSIRVVVPLSDEGPWCGDPVTDPGVDRDSIEHAILVARANDVIVSPITGSGSGGSVISLAQALANGTGGVQFSSGIPAADLAAAITSLVVDACSTVSDCNGNSVPDECDLLDGTSDNCNGNDIPDECEPDCNTNEVADDCDIRDNTSDDCDGNGVPDDCQPDCNTNETADVCDIADLTSTDCNANEIPDECELSLSPEDCRFPSNLLENTTGFDDANFTGPPDDIHAGLGGQIVTYDFHCASVLNALGPDFTVYEVDSGGAEFHLIDVLVGNNGVDFVSVKASETAAVNIPGDETHNSNTFARSYDLSAAGLAAVRYVRIDGNGTGNSGPSTGFDLDAIGAIHMLDSDCTGNGMLDVCDIADQTAADCNANGVPDSCGLALGVALDCNNTVTPDECDIADAASLDVNGNDIPDECEVDCNLNFVPDDWDIAQGTSIDCNDNDIPDECDLADETSYDCNSDGRPDECPICPTVEVVFVMDTSSSMNDEAAALCGSITQVVAELQADLIDVDAELLGISTAPGGSYACLTDYVMNLYGTVVPGSPPLGNETLGDCPGGNQVASEDWARATSVVAGTKSWLPDSIRVVVPLSDEGPWCGDPVSDPGVDRDSIDHAIVVAVANNVIVSPITGTGSDSGMIALARDLANGTGGVQLPSGVPAADLAAAIVSVLVDACSTASDCNDNGVPDDCDLLDDTSEDCNANDVPDECDPPGDLNADGYVDLADLSGMVACLTGPCAAPVCDPALYADACCLLADTEPDGDVDIVDIAAFIAAFTGSP